MGRIIVDVQSQDPSGLKSTITEDARTHSIYVRSDGVANARMPGDAWLCAALLPAMRLRAALELNSVVSETVMSGCQDIQRTLSQWEWDLDVIPIKAESITSGNSGRAGGVGCFFSGGVDSSWSAIRRPDITHLITVLGFDISLDSKWLAERVIHQHQKAAGELGKELIVVETNLREWSNGHVGWEQYHGGALACIAHALSGTVGRVYVPSSHYMDYRIKWGSHPFIDPLWSSEALQIVHDGATYTRVEKIIALARDQRALGWLRVCFENPGDAYNCGRCGKCTRAMIVLHALGVLGECPTLPNELDTERVAGLRLTHADTLDVSKLILSFLEETGSDPEVKRALRTAVRRGDRWFRLLPLRRRGYYAKRRLRQVGSRMNRLLGESNDRERQP
ncbi:MAG: hypothetical protein ACRDJS_04955 [Actinomycetota bacterium]